MPKQQFKTAAESIALETMADVEEPLMRHEPGDDEEGHDVDLSDVSLLLEKNLRHPGIFVWLLTFSAGISGLLFGCMFFYLNFLVKYSCSGIQMIQALFRQPSSQSTTPWDIP